ncbi:nuclease domain-containing protein [Larkinella terrae]|uniref:DUF2357 domain-containing protein n=1 Tax=Larkinella terrae TaxID=2025311 RepID=A0A7K0ED30_9BACT|nr:nuclease domain-containing protein [Larkinella terrae]MRS59803.1 hypothetical protein [Larkinella terrae]
MNVLVLQKTERYKPESSFSLLNEKPFVSENDFIAFLVQSEEKLPPESLLWLSEISYELNQVAVLTTGIFIYECLKNVELEDEDEGRCLSDIELEPNNRQRLQFAKIFINQFGTCEVSLDISSASIKPFKIGELEVIPSKIRPNDLNNIFDYLFERNVTYWQAFSSVKSKNTNDRIERHHLFWLLKRIQNELTILIRQLPLFKLAPRSRLVPRQEVVPWSDNVETNESSLQWLMENMSVLEQTNNATKADLRIRNRLYRLTEVQTEYLQENTDVYENQIIHGYLNSIQSFFVNQRLLLRHRVQQLTLEVNQIGTLHTRQLLRYYRKILVDCTLVIRQSETALNFFQQYIPVSLPRIEFPTKIEGFQSQEHYHSILNPIQEWFSRDIDLNFGDNELFFGTRSMDKLYELYCLFHVIAALEKLGFKLKKIPYFFQGKASFEESEHTGKYLFELHLGIEVTLYYESLPSTYQTAIWTRGNRPLKPDFIIEYKLVESQVSNLMIFDAKYQSVESIRRFTYKTMIPKYLHGICHRSGGDANIKGLFLLHPEDFGKYPVESWHLFPFRWFDSKPILPAIGRVEIPTAKGSINQLGEVISRILAITLK